ncbi:MAG: hypothetical protein ACRCXD_09680 [Luteolibacter sp.]
MRLPDFREASNALDGISLALVDGLDRVGEDAEFISSSDADPGVTVVDAERRVRRVGEAGVDGWMGMNE